MVPRKITYCLSILSINIIVTLSVISHEEVMGRIPLMVPGKNSHTFKEFIEKVKKLVAGKGLTHREILGKTFIPLYSTEKKILNKLHKKQKNSLYFSLNPLHYHITLS
jgi:hypothetical protein